MKARYPEHRALAKTMPFGVPIELPTISLLADEPENVQRRLEACWQEGGVAPLMNLYTDVLVDEKANEVVAEFVREKIRSIVDDPQVADLLCPGTYPFGAKRPCLGTDYYETFNRDNVSLVSVRENPIDTFTEKGVRLRDGQELEFDMIVFAIGFDAITGALNNIDLRGRAGVTIKEAWPMARMRTWAYSRPTSRICTSSLVPAPFRCLRTCTPRSSSTSTGSQTCSSTCVSVVARRWRPATKRRRSGWRMWPRSVTRHSFRVPTHGTSRECRR